jgi:hypothetical protein
MTCSAANTQTSEGARKSRFSIMRSSCRAALTRQSRRYVGPGDENLGPAPNAEFNLTGAVLTPGCRDNPPGEADRCVVSPGHNLCAWSRPLVQRGEGGPPESG